MPNSAYIDPATRDYILQNGQILNLDILLSRINMRLFCPLGSYYFNQTFGCSIYSYLGATSQVTNRRTLEKSIDNALQGMIEDGSLLSVKARCTLFTLSQASFTVYCVAANQQSFPFIWHVNLTDTL